MKQEYEDFFRGGGFRLMRLLVIKAEMVPERKRENLDVVTLMRLLHGLTRHLGESTANVSIIGSDLTSERG